MGNSSSIKERLSAGEISCLSEDTGFSVGQLASLYTRSAPAVLPSVCGVTGVWLQVRQARPEQERVPGEGGPALPARAERQPPRGQNHPRFLLRKPDCQGHTEAAVPGRTDTIICYPQ